MKKAKLRLTVITFPHVAAESHTKVSKGNNGAENVGFLNVREACRFGVILRYAAKLSTHHHTMPFCFLYIGHLLGPERTAVLHGEG